MTSDIKIVGLLGKAGSGKDHMANLLRTRLKFLPIALADHLKVDLIGRGELGYGEAYGQNRPERARTRLQQYGTEEMKSLYGEDIWCRYLGVWIRILNARWGADRFVVPDLRFVCEADWVQSWGGLVVKLRGQERADMTEKQRMHRSETEIERVVADVEVLNSPDRYQQAQVEMVAYVDMWLSGREAV